MPREVRSMHEEFAIHYLEDDGNPNHPPHSESETFVELWERTFNVPIIELDSLC